MPTTLGDNLIQVTENYLGPAAKRFISRQAAFHLHKKPSEITKSDIPKIAEWIKVSLGMLTQDRKMIDSCQEDILKLAKD